MDADHAQVCKFESVDGDDYEHVSGNLVALVEQAIKAFDEQQRLLSLAPQSSSLSSELIRPACK